MRKDRSDTSFFDYAVEHYEGCSSPEGDLIEDLLNDEYFEDVTTASAKAILEHLNFMGADGRAVEAFDNIWAKFCEDKFDDIESRLLDSINEITNTILCLYSLRKEMEGNE